MIPRSAANKSKNNSSGGSIIASLIPTPPRSGNNGLYISPRSTAPTRNNMSPHRTTNSASRLYGSLLIAIGFALGFLASNFIHSVAHHDSLAIDPTKLNSNSGIDLPHPSQRRKSKKLKKEKDDHPPQSKLAMDSSSSTTSLKTNKNVAPTPKNTATAIRKAASTPNATPKNASRASLIESSKKEISPAMNVSFLPPLEEIIEQMQSGHNNTAGQIALDFAILGHAKCGTSTMMYWLAQHPEVAAFPWEITTLQKKEPWDLVRRIYSGLPDGPFKRGYKSPNDIEDFRVINLLRGFFPKTKLFIGLRHPVRWFESFYNYRIQNGMKMPPAEELAKRCMGGQNNVCTDRARYHVIMSKLGKTDLTGSELSTFGPRELKRVVNEDFPRVPNPVFLYDTAQLSDQDIDRAANFRNDMKQFVGLTQDLPPALHYSPGHSDLNETEQARRNSLKIDICNDKYIKQRIELVRIGTDAQRWILEYFLNNPDVMVSNPEHFAEIMDSYTRDPCGPLNITATTTNNNNYNNDVTTSRRTEIRDNTNTTTITTSENNNVPAVTVGKESSREALIESSRKQIGVPVDDDPFPPLDEVTEAMQHGNDTAGQFALDFAILGHAKCGTSTMMYWLGQHPEVAAFPWEITTLQQKEAWDLVRRIYKGLPRGRFYRGYKSPNDVENQRVKNILARFFPKTKLFVGLRHPVRWYESFYNYRIQNGIPMPPADTLDNRCVGGQNNVCTDRAKYHVHLARFGKTNMTQEEMLVFDVREQRALNKDENHFPTPNPIFLYETTQLSDKNEARTEIFRQDIQRFVGLKEALPPALHYSPGHEGLDEAEQARRDALKIDICEDRYKKVRSTLVGIGSRIHDWLLNYFLKSPDVYVSNIDHFHEILESYTRDPCEGAIVKTIQ